MYRIVIFNMFLSILLCTFDHTEFKLKEINP